MYLISIAGGSGSGKTTYAKKLVNLVSSEDIAILHMDSYYFPSPPQSNYTENGKPNFDCPDAFDWELLHSHLKALKKGNEIDVPIYDFSISRRTKNIQKFGPAKIVIFEGILTLYRKEIRDLSDIKIFLHVDSDIRFIRRLSRDLKERGREIEATIEQYYETVRPMHQLYLGPQKQYADLIIGEETDIAAEILAAKLKERYNLYKTYSNSSNRQNQSSQFS